MIYFIQSLDKIKVGYTTNINHRMRGLKTANPHGLILIGTVKGKKTHEHKIHKALNHHNVVGEWFQDCEEVREYINRVLNKDYTLQFKCTHVDKWGDATNETHKLEEPVCLASWEDHKDKKLETLLEIVNRLNDVEKSISKLLVRKNDLDRQYLKVIRT